MLDSKLPEKLRECNEYTLVFDERIDDLNLFIKEVRENGNLLETFEPVEQLERRIPEYNVLSLEKLAHVRRM